MLCSVKITQKTYSEAFSIWRQNYDYYSVLNKRTHPNKRTTPHSKKFFKNIPTQINVPPDKPKGFPKFHTSPLKGIPPLKLTFHSHDVKVRLK